MYVPLENNYPNKPTLFGYELLRDHVLPSLLGKHEKDILYWAGKEIARKFPVFTIEELPSFFQEAGWGELTITKTTKESTFYILKVGEGVQIEHRSFTLEAGFLAEQYQKLNGLFTECYGVQESQKGIVKFEVRWDRKLTITE